MAIGRRSAILVGLCAAAFAVALLHSDLRGGNEPRLNAIRATVVGHPWATFGDPLPTIGAARALNADWRADLYKGFRREGASFIYPPFAAVLFQPLAAAENPLTPLLRFNQLAFLAIVLIAAALAWPPERERKPLVMAGAAIAALTFHPLTRAVELNQGTVVVTLALGVALLAFDRGRADLAGIPLGLAISIKPHMVIMLPLLWWHARKTVVSTVLTGAALLMISLIAAGVANHIDYASVVIPRLSDGYAFYPNQSWNGLLNRIVSDDMLHFALAPSSSLVRSLAAVLGLATLAVGGIAAYRARTDQSRAPLWFGFAWLVATLASPISWEHHYAPALFLFALWFRTRIRDPQVARWDVLVAIAWILIANYFEVRGLQSTAGRLLASYGLAGGLIFAAVYQRACRSFDNPATPDASR